MSLVMVAMKGYWHLIQCSNYEASDPWHSCFRFIFSSLKASDLLEYQASLTSD